MKNLKDINEFLNENEESVTFTGADMINGTKKWEICGEYFGSLMGLSEREKAVAGEFEYLISEGKEQWDDKWDDYEDTLDDDEIDLSEYVQMETDEELLGHMIWNTGDQVHDGAYTEEENPDGGWFSEEDFDIVMEKYVLVPGLSRPDHIEFYYLTGMAFVNYMMDRNPVFCWKYLGKDQVIDSIKSNVEKGVPMDYLQIIKMMNTKIPNIKQIMIKKGINMERINKLSKGFRLLQRK